MRGLCHGARVRFQQSTQPLPKRDCIHRRDLAPQLGHRSQDRQVALRLMRSLGVIVIDVLPDQIVDVLLPAQDKVIQALLPERLDEPLDLGLQIR